MWVEVKDEGYKKVAHSFTETYVGKKACSNCGLLALNNPFSQWAVKKGCLHNEHPEYKRMRKASKCS